MYTVTVTDEQLAIIRDALGFNIEAKPVRKRAPRNAGPKLLPLPKSPGLPPLRPLKVREFEQMERDWNRACIEAAEDVAAGRQSQAEIHLRDLIALHRPTPADQGEEAA